MCLTFNTCTLDALSGWLKVCADQLQVSPNNEMKMDLTLTTFWKCPSSEVTHVNCGFAALNL